MNRHSPLLLTLILSVLFINSNLALSDDAKEILKADLLFSPKSYEPTYSTTSGESFLLKLLYEGLYTTDENGVRALGQAQDIELFEDENRIRVTLRDDIVWSDGTPVVSNDFLISYSRLVDPSVNLFPKANYLASSILNAPEIQKGEKSIKDLGVKVIDEKTFDITFTNSLSYMPELFSYPAMAPLPSKLVRETTTNWAESIPLVSNGPYNLVDVVLEEDGTTIYELEKNDKYYNAKNIYYRKIHLLYSPDKDSLKLYSEGRIDIAQETRGFESPLAEKNISNTVMKSGKKIMTVYVAFNLEDEILKDKRVRTALTLATNRKQLSTLYPDNISAAHSFASPSKSAEWRIKQPEYEKMDMKVRISLARSLLKDAGYTNDNPITLPFSYNDTASNKKLFDELKRQWSHIGVHIEPLSLPGKEHYEHLRKGKYRIARAAWAEDFDDPSNYLQILTTDHVKNYAGWSSKYYDAIVKKLIHTSDKSNRNHMFTVLENLISHELPILPLYQKGSVVLHRDNLSVILSPSSRGVAMQHTKPIDKK